MLEILKFVFSSFWIWLGTLILLATVAEGIGGLIRITMRRQPVITKVKEIHKGNEEEGR